MLVAWFGGIIMQWFKPERWVEDYVWKTQMVQVALPEQDTSLKGRHRYALAEVKEIVGRIWKWVLIGIGVGALFHGFVPENWVSEHLAGGNLFDVPTAVILGIPLYSNATGIIPPCSLMMRSIDGWCRSNNRAIKPRGSPFCQRSHINAFCSSV